MKIKLRDYIINTDLIIYMRKTDSSVYAQIKNKGNWTTGHNTQYVNICFGGECMEVNSEQDDFDQALKLYEQFKSEVVEL